MAIAHDADGTGNTAGASTTTFSWSHTCTGSNGALVVAVAMQNGSGNTGSSGATATYNSVSMTYLGQGTAGGAVITFWLLLAPSTGSNTVAITLTSADVCVGNSVSFTGVQQSGQPDASNYLESSSSSPFNMSLTTVNNNCWVISGGKEGLSGGGTFTNTGTQTTSNISIVSLFTCFLGYSGPIATPGSVTHQWSFTSGSGTCRSCMISLIPAAAGTPDQYYLVS